VNAFNGRGLGIVFFGLGLDTLVLGLKGLVSEHFSKPYQIYLSSVPAAKMARSSLFAS